MKIVGVREGEEKLGRGWENKFTYMDERKEEEEETVERERVKVRVIVNISQPSPYIV